MALWRVTWSPREAPSTWAGTWAEAFTRHAGVDLLASIDRAGGVDRDVLAASATAAGIRVADDDTWADVFSRILVEKIEQLPRSLQEVFAPLELIGNRWPHSQSGMITPTRGLPPPLPIRARAS